MSELRALWGSLRESLWFVPTIIVLGAIALAAVMVELSAVVGTEALARWPRVFGVGADGSRSLLSAIAGSMITVAGVTFSMTMVAVTQASAQYSPRVLRNFMRDRANQTILGTFVGIFAYCLVVLRTIRGGDEGSFVPSLAVVMGLVLAMVGIGVLIFFVHHIATILQASEIISRIATDTGRAIDDLYPEERDTDPAEETWRPAGTMSAHQVPAPETGYLQRVDIAGLVGLAEKHDLAIRLRYEAGDFVTAGLPLAAFVRLAGTAEEDGRPPAELAATLSRRFFVNTYRTFEQDAGFGFRQLVDVAMKALSPGINDTSTAVTCVDYLGALLVQLCNRHIGLAHRDEAGTLRVLVPGPTFERLLGLAMDEIRQHAKGNVSVLGRQLDALGLVAGVTRPPGRRRAILGQIELIHAAAAAGVGPGPDLEWLERRARHAIEAAQALG